MTQKNGFSENAHLYRVSQAHSEVEDLERAFENSLVSGLSVLDVATGTGHAAFFLARKDAHVFAVDINQEMLRVAQEESEKLSLSVRFLYSACHDLVFDDEAFDIVTCRLAAHHFKRPGDFLAECLRVLKPNGKLVLIDNVAPDDSQTAEWLNAYERRRDPSHQRCLSVNSWTALLQEQGFCCEESQSVPTTVSFTPWMERMSHDETSQDQFWQDLLEAPDSVKAIWKPRQTSNGQRDITLSRHLFISRKPS